MLWFEEWVEGGLLPFGVGRKAGQQEGESFIVGFGCRFGAAALLFPEFAPLDPAGHALEGVREIRRDRVAEQVDIAEEPEDMHAIFGSYGCAGLGAGGKDFQFFENILMLGAGDGLSIDGSSFGEVSAAGDGAVEAFIGIPRIRADNRREQAEEVMGGWKHGDLVSWWKLVGAARAAPLGMSLAIALVGRLVLQLLDS